MLKKGDKAINLKSLFNMSLKIQMDYHLFVWGVTSKLERLK